MAKLITGAWQHVRAKSGRAVPCKDVLGDAAGVGQAEQAQLDA